MADTASPLRIPFEVAIAEPRLLKPRFDELSKGQQTALKVAYGVRLSDVKDEKGWSEQDYWAAFQGFAEYDKLGAITRILPGVPAPREGEWPEAWAIAGVRSGKALALSTLLPTPQGWTTMGSVHQGDYLLGRDGLPAQVIAVSPVQVGRPCYRVVFSDKSVIIADADHLWWANAGRDRNARNHSLQTVTTKEMADTLLCKGQMNWAVPVADPLDLPEVPLPLDPYILGVWLGDGTTLRAELTSMDPSIPQAVVDAGYVQSYCYLKPDNKASTFGYVGGLRQALQAAGVLGNKHIPPTYLRASYAQRLALLGGLVDSDGSVERGRCIFYNTNERLARQVFELAASLGMRPTLRFKRATLYGKDCGLLWAVTMTPRMPIGRLPRKLDAQRVSWGPGRKWRYVTSVEPVESVPVKCVVVDNADHSYLVGDAMIPTHNSDTFASTVLAYEATCGGHEHWLRRGKRAICFLIAQDLRFARWSLPGILATLESMPFISGAKGTRQIERVTADQIDLKNGISIAVVPPTVKAVRGFDAPVAVMDEVGIWSLTSESANPDFEVYRQIKSRQAQFSDGKIVAISSPWVKQGMLWEAYRAGTEGRSLQCEVCGQVNGSCPSCVKMREPHQNRLVLHATTASLGNPLVKESWLRDTEQKDPRAFARECLAQFVDALSGFLDPSLLEKAVDDGVRERAPSPRASYVAAMDPAFRRDAFGFSIAHVDKERGVVIDVLRRWPAPGERRTTPLNPQDILQEIAVLLRQYHIGEVVSDQYHIDTLQQLAINLGFSIRQVTFASDSKASIYANLQQLLNQKRLILLDHPETLRELKVIEKRNMPGGTVKIGSPRGDHDDMATVVALAAHQAVWMLPPTETKRAPEPTVQEKIAKQIAKRRFVATQGDWAW